MANKLLKATISGSFKASDGQIESYDNVTGFLPAVEEDKAQQMIIRRYAIIWVGQAKDSEGNALYKRVQRMRQVFVDSVEDIENKKLSYVGKSIMEMGFEELQDVAAAKDLAGVPLYKATSLTTARRVAFCEYANKVLGWTEVREHKGVKQPMPLDHRIEGFNPSKYPAIIADGIIRRDGEVPAPIEDTLLQESLVMQGKAAPVAHDSRLTLEQLKEIAKSKGITYNANIGYEALHKKIYVNAA